MRGFVRLLSVAGCLSVGAGGFMTEALAQTRWPRIDAEDVGVCRREIGEFHRREIAFITKSNADYCAQETVTPAECQKQKDSISETVNMGDIAWFMKGNGRCEMSDYPCFGPALYNDDRSRDPDGGAHWLEIFRDQANKPVSGVSGFAEYTDVVEACVAKVFIAKYEALNQPRTDTAASGRVTNTAGMSQMASGDGGADGNGAQVNEGAQSGAGGVNGDAGEQQVASLPRGAGGNGGTSGDPAGAAACKEALAAQDAEFAAMNKRGQAIDGTKFGTRALFQLGMYIMDERMKVLDASCKGQPEYAQYAGAKKSYDSAKNSCAQVSTDNGETCVPLKLW